MATVLTHQRQPTQENLGRVVVSSEGMDIGDLRTHSSTVLGTLYPTGLFLSSSSMPRRTPSSGPSPVADRDESQMITTLFERPRISGITSGACINPRIRLIQRL